MTAGIGASPAGAAETAKVSTVATGFDNPRGLAIGEDGQLYVAEAGKGGPKCIPGGPGGDICPGLTGAISVIWPNGEHSRIVSGLASISGRDGFAATGPDGLSRTGDTLYSVITSCPQQVAQVPPGVFPEPLLDAVSKQVGQVVKVEEHGRYDLVGAVGKTDWNFTLTHMNLVPPMQWPDCNPYAILADSRGQWVIDAATNTLDRVTDGRVSVVKFIPNPPKTDAVPTCVAKGRDGALYIGELTGGGNPPGSSVVWRFDPRTRDLDEWASGLTAVTGCGFGPDGNFFATEFSTKGFATGGPRTGAVVEVAPHSTSPTVIASGLSFPNGFAATDDAIYVSNWSISTASPPAPSGFAPGSVVKISVED
jgi:hypothetical protein